MAARPFLGPMPGGDREGRCVRPPIALVCTTLNEGATVDELMASVAAQTLAPAEIVVVDGGSSDDTVDRLQRWAECGLPLRVISRPGASISAGRNTAIAATSAPIVAVTDAGVRLEPGWLAALAAPFVDGRVEVVSGFFRSDPRSRFELALGATTLPLVAEIEPARFLPSSRSIAFRRAAWERVGGYPEWLDYCEDLVFDLALREAGCCFAWAPAAIAHFRPRPTLAAFARQYFHYARGDGKADLWRRRHAVRYATYLAAPLLAAAGRRWRVCWLALAVGALAYSQRPWRRLWAQRDGWALPDLALAAALVPLIRLTGDLAKMAGYPAGWWWRVRRRPGRRPPGRTGW